MSISATQPTALSRGPAVIPPHHSGWRAFHDKNFWIVWLEHAIFFALIVLVLAAPFSEWTVLFTFRIAVALWIVKLGLTRFKVGRDPLALPLLLFFVAVGVSTVFSYGPLLSWLRMAWYSVALIFFLVTQNIRNSTQLKGLVAALLLSTSITAIQTGWQFTAGIGTKLVYVPAGPLRQAGLRAGDIVREINGHSVRRPWLWRRALRLTQGDSVLRLRLARPFPGGIHHYYTTLPRAAMEQWLRTPGKIVSQGYPPRAQGHFYHSVPYAGMLMVVAALSWGLLLASGCAKTGKRVLLGLVFLALAASLSATVTRSYVLALLAACLFTLWISARWTARTLGIVAALAVIAAGSFWIHARRHVSWFSTREAGTEYRLMMWEDSPRLIREHPLLGIGLDSVQLPGNRFNLQAYKRFPLRGGHFHSTYVELAVDCGLPALGLWLWLMVAYFRHLVGLLRLSAQAAWFYRGLALGIFTSAIAFYIGCVVQYTLGDGEVMPLVWLFMGISVVLSNLLRERMRTESSTNNAGAALAN